MTDEITGIILVGGKGRRFGSEKAKALLGGIPLVEWVRRGLERHCQKVVAVTAPGRRHPELDLEVWEDLQEGKGVLGGIASGLAKASTPWVLAAGCDLPFLHPDLVGLLLRHSRGSDVVVPRTARGCEPLRALYGKGCLQAMQRRIEEGDLKVHDFFREVQSREVLEEEIQALDPDLRSFFNINVQADLQAAEILLREGKVSLP